MRLANTCASQALFGTLCRLVYGSLSAALIVVAVSLSSAADAETTVKSAGKTGSADNAAEQAPVIGVLQEPKIEPGYWEVLIQGDPSIQLERQVRELQRRNPNMPADARQEMREMVARQMQANVDLQTDCISAEDARKGLARLFEQDEGPFGAACKWQIDWQGITAGVNMFCSEGGSGIGTLMVSSPREIASLMRLVDPNGNIFSLTWRARWVAPECPGE